MNIHQVAKRAKVSIATVSRTLNNVRSVNPAIADRIWRAVDELGYHPNTQARALVSGRSRILGLIVSDITNPFFPEVIRGFEEVAVPAGFEVLLSSTNHQFPQMADAVRRMLERKAEGIAIMTSEFDNSLIEELSSRKIPLVFVDVGPHKPHISNIKVNYLQGIQEAVRHLLRLGHHRIAFVSGPQQLKSARIRREVFLRCLEENGIDISSDLTIAGEHNVESGFRAVPKLLSLKQPPTAILTSNDLTAVGLLCGLDREGLRAPADMSIIGFDDIHLAQFTLPPLTTIRLSRPELARVAFQALMADMEGSAASTHGATYSIETSLIVRNSTAPPRKQEGPKEMRKRPAGARSKDRRFRA
ncbi:MAG: LacI family DNA-binding transcriptional regulator [Bryobacteraceae bacterium]